MNPNLMPIPIGAIGELYIGGAGLARGYLNRPDLTAEKFIANPFQTEEERAQNKNSRLYKTGDLVRWLPDGNIEYIGRNDFQVKVRGYRIELGEIENALSNYPEIKQSVVVAKEHTGIEGVGTGNKYLVGYYVSEVKLEEADILNYLQSKLPEYMVPSVLVHLDRLPLTINGKLDRKGLPEPEFTREDSYIGPRNEIENKVCQIWAEVLGLPEDKVGIRDDFFRLGGDSIISIQLVSRLRQKLNLTINIKDIFNYKSIERLYDNILAKNLTNVVKELKSEQGILSGEVPLLPIQEWFFASNFVVANHWNQSFLVKTPNLDIDRLNKSLVQLIEYHDSLGLRYSRTDEINRYVQYYNIDRKPKELRLLDIRTLQAKEGSKQFEDELQKILTEWQSDFNLEQGSLYSIGYIYGYADGSSRIYFALHHLIVDAVSWRILAEDLKDFYQGKGLGVKGSSYRQWVNAVRTYAATHEEERSYWTDVLSGYEAERLNSLRPNKDTKSYSNLFLDQEQTKKLLRESNRAYNTEVNDILLTALGYTLAEITNSRVNYIVLEGHGREEIDNQIDLSRTIGWFTTMYPVKLEICDELGKSIKRIKESLRRVPNKGIGYGALLGYQNPVLPKISFNYLGQFNKEEGISDLWNITGESSGIPVDAINQDYNIININGLVIDNILQFGIASQLDEETTNRIAVIFKQKLGEIVNHVINQTRSYLTASDVNNIINQEYLDKLQRDKEIEGVYLANSLQQGFIYHTLNQGDVDDAYRVQLIWQYHCRVEIERLKEAWSYAQKRYPTLRLRLVWEEELVQVIDKVGELDWRYIDLSEEQDFEVQELRIKQVQEEDRLEPYKLDRGNLFRVYIIKQREDFYTCIFSNHHAILDGWSMPILLDYVHSTYLRLINKREVLLSTDHSYEYTQKYLQRHIDDNKGYWDGYVGQIEERVDLTGLLSNDSKYLRLSDYKHIKLPKEQTLIIRDKLYIDLRKLSQEEGITLNAILQYVWHKILNIYGNSNQTIVGTTISGRNLPIDNIESSVGLYINTLPLIVDHGDKTAKDIIGAIKGIQANINEINSRSNISLAKLQKEGERLFDSLFVYENYPTPSDRNNENELKLEFKGVLEKLDYPLGITAYEINGELIYKVTYASELFSDEVIENLLSIAKTLLTQIAENSYRSIQSLRYLSEEQYKQIVYKWNETDKEYPRDKTIQKLFEEQVERTPANIAVVYEETKLTYKELNERANRLANYLRSNYDIKADDLIALCLDRSEHMLIGILAVLKAGGAYVPMDPGYPDERIQYVLKDTRAKVVLTNIAHKQRLGSITKAGSLAIDSEELQELLLLQSKVNPITETLSTNLAYVIYTSGTTGRPKGVMIEHRGVLSTI